MSRNLGHCSRKIKEAAFTTFVRPTVEYASTSWDPHTQRNVQKVEQVQRSAARFVMGNFNRFSSVTSMLKELNWPSLQERRQQSRLIMMYKIFYDLVDIPWSQYLTRLPTSTRGHSSRFTISVKLICVLRLLLPMHIRDWNNLSSDPAEYQCLDAFKMVLRCRTFYLHICKYFAP